MSNIISKNTPFSQTHFFGWLSLFVLLIALFFRLIYLVHHLPWFDEALCIFQSEKIGPLLDGTILSNNPPFFYIVLSIWRIPSDSLFWMRCLPVVFGVLSVFVVLNLSRRFFDPLTAFWAGILFALSPTHIYYSQEIKMYSLNVLLGLLAFQALMNLHDKKSIKNSVVFGIIQVLMAYTHYYLFVWSITLHFIFLYLNYRQLSHVKKLIISDTISLLLYLPWLKIYLDTHLHLTVSYVTTWIPIPGIKSLFYSYKNFIVGFHSTRHHYWIVVILSLGIWIVIARYVFPTHKRKIIILILASLSPVLIVAMISQFVPLYLDRYILYTLPFLLILLATGLKVLHQKISWSIPLIFCVLPLITLPNLYASKIPFPHHIPGEHERPEFRAVLMELKTHFQPGDKIFHISRRTNLSFEYAWPNKQKIQPFRTVFPYEKYPEPRYWPHSPLRPKPLCSFLEKGNRIWAVLYKWKPQPNDPEIKGTRELLMTHGDFEMRLGEDDGFTLECYRITQTCRD